MVNLERNELLTLLALRFVSSTEAGGPRVRKVMSEGVVSCANTLV